MLVTPSVPPSALALKPPSVNAVASCCAICAALWPAVGVISDLWSASLKRTTRRQVSPSIALPASNAAAEDLPSARCVASTGAAASSVSVKLHTSPAFSVLSSVPLSVFAVGASRLKPLTGVICRPGVKAAPTRLTMTSVAPSATAVYGSAALRVSALIAAARPSAIFCSESTAPP